MMDKAIPNLRPPLLIGLLLWSVITLACPPGDGGDAKDPATSQAPGPNTAQTDASAGGGAPPPASPASNAAPTSGSAAAAKAAGANPPAENQANAKAAEAAPSGENQAEPAREPAAKAEPKITVAPYVPKMWSCSCANLHKICDKGFVFTSIAEATSYAKQQCGKSCIPSCTGHAR